MAKRQQHLSSSQPFVSRVQEFMSKHRRAKTAEEINEHLATDLGPGHLDWIPGLRRVKSAEDGSVRWRWSGPRE